MVKLQEIKGQFTITLPKQLVKKKQWKKGKELFIGFNEKGNLEISD